MKRGLNQISDDFKAIQSNEKLNQEQKNIRYVNLMNELERYYGVFILNATDEELAEKREEISLYQEISFARTIF